MKTKTFAKFKLLFLILWLPRILIAQEATRSYSELYEDLTTGQTFTKPGPNRVRLVPLARSVKDKDGTLRSEEEIEKYQQYQKEPLPAGFANTAQNPIGEKLTIVGRVQFRGVSGQKDTIWSNGHSDFNAVDWNLRRARIGLVYQSNQCGTIVFNKYCLADGYGWYSTPATINRN